MMSIKFDKIFNPEHTGIVLFTKKGCNPCSRFKPIFEKVAERMPHLRMHEYELLTKKDTDFAAEWQITSVPALTFWTGKKVTKIKTGRLSEEDLFSYIDKNYIELKPEK